MSTHAQCKVISKSLKCPIYLYQHSDGYALGKIVRNAIAKGIRWNDPSYLIRIIFSEMIKDDIEDELGYGISTSQSGDIEYLIEVNIGKQTVTEYSMSWGGTDKKVVHRCTFDECTMTLESELYK